METRCEHKEAMRSIGFSRQIRPAEGYVFRKLDVKGCVFIEYAPLETAWTSVVGEDYYLYPVSGSRARRRDTADRGPEKSKERRAPRVRTC